MALKYQDAIQLLRSRLRPFGSSPIKNLPNNLNMIEWLSELGCKVDPSALNVIHVTGTKGKGSTAAYTDAFLRAHSRRLSRPLKIGLYTSPHLQTERDRICIDAEPISEKLFTSTLFEVWDTLQACGRSNGDDDGGDRMPGYLQLLALQSVIVFQKESVDVAIFEVHAGGRKDATNIFDRPIACGITTIGLDHADLLGNTIESVAGHKSGIMKRGRPVFSLPQERAAQDVLEGQAQELGCPLEFVDTNADITLKPPAQKLNASLAVHLANAFLGLQDKKLTRADISDGLGQCNWPGRFQKICKGSSAWYLDCAHNSLSIPIALSWFRSEQLECSPLDPPGERKQILIFGHKSARDTRDLISVIVDFCSKNNFYFHTIILSPYRRYGQEIYNQSQSMQEHLGFWQHLQPLAHITIATSIRQAMKWAGEQGYQNPKILITGSVHLVGQALTLLQEG